MIWLWITIGLALLEWIAAWKSYVRLNRIAKPAVIISLLLWFSQMAGWTHGLSWFGLALILSLAGDIFLLFQSNRAFYAGLASFMLAHVFYIIGFNQSLIPFQWPIIPILLFIVIMGLSVGKIILKGLRKRLYRKRMIAPVLAYIGIICLMLLSTILTHFRPDWTFISAICASAGGLFFTVSDSMLGYDRFVKNIWHGRFWVMSTYHIAQVLITISALTYAGLLHL